MDQDVLQLGSVDPGYTRDPYPVYSELRQSTPVRRVLLHGLPGWLVTRYEDVRQALKNPTLSHDRVNAGPAARAAGWLFADEAFGLQHHMLRSDPPTHTRIRRLASQAFTARRVAELVPCIRQIADGLIDGFAPDGHAELISAYAFPLPLMVIMKILGVPCQDRGQLERWSDVLSSGAMATPAEITTMLTSMRDYFADLVERKHQRSEDKDAGLLDVLVTACYRDGMLSEAELLSSAFQLLQGGHVTTLGLIANGMLALLRNPDMLATLQVRPDLIDVAVGELLRYDPPMQVATIRFTTVETSVGGVVIPGGGDALILALGAANRDSTKFATPDQLDLQRDTSGHLSFGYGAHVCLGASLARAEARVAFRALIERLDGLALAIDPADLVWRPNPHLRRPELLPVQFSASKPLQMRRLR